MHFCIDKFDEWQKMRKRSIDSKDVENMLRLTRTFPALTVTEVHIFALVERGLTSREIANLFGCSLRNIENHRYRIGKKVRVEKTIHESIN